MISQFLIIRFVRFVSHEVRTPLNIVNMSLQLLEQEMFRHTAYLLDHSYRKERFDHRDEAVEKIVDSLMVG